LFDLVEEVLNQITGAIKVMAKADRLRPVPPRRDICPRAMLADKRSDPICVIPTISEQHCSRFKTDQQGEDKTIVVRFASSQRETNRMIQGSSLGT